MLKAYPKVTVVSFFVVFILILSSVLSCSGLKVDLGTNCRNEKSGCFKPDVTKPQFLQSVPISGGSAPYVSTLPEIQLIFSEELKDPQPSDFVFIGGDTGVTITSVEKVDRFTYRLRTSRNPIVGGDLTLSFPNLKDYNGNKIANTSATFKIDLSIPISIDSKSRDALSGLAPLPPIVPGSPNLPSPPHPPGYQTITVTWHFDYNPVIAGTSIYHLRRSTAVDCSTGTPLTPTGLPAPTPPVNTTVNTYDGTAGTQYSFTLNKDDIPAGNHYILICVTNAVNNKTGVQFVPVTRDDDVPAMTLSPSIGNFAAPQTMTFTCGDNADRIAYATDIRTDGSFPAAGSIADPEFDAVTGAVLSGTAVAAPYVRQTPYTTDPTRSIFKYRCIDKAGNPSPVYTTGTIDVNSSNPVINVVSLNKTSYVPATAITGIGTGGHTSATLTWNTNQLSALYEIRANGTDCGSGGTQLETGGPGIAGTPATAFTAKTIDLTPVLLGGVEQVHTIRVCVHNGTLWGQSSFPLILDNTQPTTTVNVPAGSYGSQQSLVFNCSNNADKIAYSMTTAPLGSVPAVPTNPDFNPAGEIVPGTGTLHTTPVTAMAQTVTSVRWKCFNKAGRQSIVNSATYTIDAVLPTVTVANVQRHAVSSLSGAYPTTQITWNSDREGLVYEVRNSGNCNGGPGGGGVAGAGGSATRYAGVTPASGNNVVTTLSIAAGDFPSITTFSYKICVFNVINGAGFQTTALDIARDETNPIFPGPANITPVDATNFTITFAAATDVNLAGYRIYRSETPGVYPNYPALPDYIVTSLPPTITMPNLNPQYMRIVAFDIAGNTTIIASGEITTKPTITLAVSGASGNFNLTDGASSQTVSGSGAWTTGLATGGAYSFAVMTQPPGQVCSIRQRQFGTLSANITVNIDCVNGYMTAGRYQAAPAAKMLSLPYRTRSEVWVSSFAVGELPNSVAVAGNNVYFGTDMDCDAGALVRYCIYRRATATAGSPSLVVNNLPGIVRGIASDGSNLYFTTISGDNRLYKVPLAGGTPIEIAAGFDNPYAMALDGHDAYICNRSAGAIVKVDLRTGIKTNVVTGIADPIGISIVGNYVYFTRWNLHAIFRTLKDGTGSIETPYGSAASFGHIDDIGTAARFKTPHDLASDGVDNLFVAEYNNHTIRRIRLANGRVTTLVGDSTIASMIYSNGTGPAAHLPRPVGLTSDGRNLYASLHGERRIIKLFEDKLTAHWPLAGNTNDYGGDGNFVKNGTITGNVSAAGGRYGETGGAYSFDGASDYIASPAGSAADTYFNTSNFTISFWIKPATVQLENGGAPRDYDVVTNLGSQYDYAIRYHNEIASAATIPPNTPGQLIFVRFDGTVSAYCMSGVRIDDGNFHHVAAQKLGGTIQLFIDGRKACSTADTVGTINLASVVPLQIGARPGFANNDFTGSIAEMRTYRRALSEGEINELAQDAGGTTQVGSGYNTGATGLLSHYEFNANGATPTTTDSGPLGYTLTPQGSPGTVFGKDGDPTGAFHLNGSNQYLTNATTAGLPMGNHPRTLCGWIRPASYPGTSSSYYMMGYSGSTLSQLGMGNYSGSQGIVYHSNNDLVHIPYTLPLNTWSHLCAAYTGTQVTIYLNGKALGTEPAVSSTAFGASGTFVGIQPNLAYALHGAVDDVRIYDNTLGELQIRQLATQVPMGLVAHFDLSDDIAGAKAVDSSGRGESASIAGATQSSDRFGNTNQAYNFNSSAHNITGSDAGLPTGSSPRTLCAWIRPTAYPAISYGHIIKYGTAATGRMAGLTLYNNSGIQQITHSAYAADHNVTYAVPLNTWTHICASYTPGTPNISQIFINGASYSGASMTTFDTTLAGNSGLSIGNAMYDTAQRLTGDIDDVRVYSRALTTNDVRALAGYHPVQVTNGFSDMKMHLEPEAATYANGGCNGGINCISAWSDSSTSMNNVAQGTAGSQPVFEASGINGKPSVKFVGGSATYLTGACSSALNSAATTMLTVYREINTTGHNGIFQNGAQLAGKMLYFKDNIQPNRPVLFDLAGNTENLAANSTYHSSGDIVLMSLHFNGTTGSLYKNGNLFASTSTASAAYNCGGGALHIGRYYFGGTYPSDGGYFDGSLGNFLFYSSVLSAADRLRAECYLSAKYRIPLQGSPPPTCP